MNGVRLFADKKPGLLAIAANALRQFACVSKMLEVFD